MTAPVVLFVYNRPWHTLQTLNALMNNLGADETSLYIFADGAKEGASVEELAQIQETRQVIKSKQWCKKVIIEERSRNHGLAASIVQGVTQVVNEFGSVIVLEDDIVTTTGFLNFMNDALKLYESELSVYHISGYMYPLKNVKMPSTLFLNVVTPWGWATWKDRWRYYQDDAYALKTALLSSPNFTQRSYNAGFGNEFYDQLIANIEGRLRTWAVKWHSSIYLQKGFCLHPGVSMVTNIGFDDSGENCGNEVGFKPGRLASHVNVAPLPLVQRKDILHAFHNFYLELRHKQQKRPHFVLRRLRKLRMMFFNR